MLKNTVNLKDIYWGHVCVFSKKEEKPTISDIDIAVGYATGDIFYDFITDEMYRILRPNKRGVINSKNINFEEECVMSLKKISNKDYELSYPELYFLADEVKRRVLSNRKNNEKGKCK